jgi:malate dehydrogenase (oxaloacetate-decarboxylating)
MRPVDYLRSPLYNKGTAFSQEERDALHLHGLLPCHISSAEEQLDRLYKNFAMKKTDLGKYVFLSSLMNRNEILFYLFAEKHLEEVFPLIYTPTVGEAALEYSLIYKRPRGLYLSLPLQKRMDKMMDNLPQDEVSICVVTDGERILGLGDQGIGGMVIPIGKLALYTLFGGIHPKHTLPVILDVGTNNETLLNHPLYLGLQEKRAKDEIYDAFVDTFVSSFMKKYPQALLQWEDFGKNNALRLLQKYEDKLCSFNDDIQGTAAVALAGILACAKVTKRNLSQSNIVIFGGGSAGMGIAYQLKSAMIEEGISEQEAEDRIFIVDRHGLVVDGSPYVRKEQKPFAKNESQIRKWQRKHDLATISLQEVVDNITAHVLIGVSAQGGAFTKDVIKTMAAKTEQPIIFPLSNPTSKAEAFPEEIIQWTKGKALIATGSPFGAVNFKGRMIHIGQCNNVFIFPGIGLGSIAVRAKKVTEGMFLKAAHTLATLSPRLANPYAPLFPHLREVKQACFDIAVAVGEQAIEDKVASPCDVTKAIRKIYWTASYESLSK